MSFTYMFLWIVIFVLPMRLSYYILENKRINYRKRNILSGLIFILFSTLIIAINQQVFNTYFTFNSYLISLIVFTILIALLGTYFFKKNLVINKKILEEKSSPYFLNFSLPFLFTKTNDIFFQQLMILMLLNQLIVIGLSMQSIVILFVLLFSTLHLFTLFKHGLYGLYFFFFSLIGSFLFPVLILTVGGGIFYSISIHIFSYILGRTLFGIYFNYIKKE